MKGKNYRIIITELNMARDKIKYKDKYLKYAGVFFSLLMRNQNPRN